MGALKLGHCTQLLKLQGKLWLQQVNKVCADNKSCLTACSPFNRIEPSLIVMDSVSNLYGSLNKVKFQIKPFEFKGSLAQGWVEVVISSIFICI